jgi:hypothetical protein
MIGRTSRTRSGLGALRRCETDRSIAITHGLESLCKVEVKTSKGKPKKKSEEEDLDTE